MPGVSAGVGEAMWKAWGNGFWGKTFANWAPRGSYCQSGTSARAERLCQYHARAPSPAAMGISPRSPKRPRYAMSDPPELDEEEEEAERKSAQ